MTATRINLGSVVGPKGETGPQGPQGPQGTQGDDGSSIVIKGQVAEVADLPDFDTTEVGSAYVVENTGDDQFDLYIRGEDAEEGQDPATWTVVTDWQGKKGDTGPQGPAGAQGIQGEQGEKGETGPQGDLLVPQFSIDENGELWVEYEDGTTDEVENGGEASN